MASLDATVGAPASRQPGLAMAVNGAPMPGLISLLVTRNNYLAADTFVAEVALDATGPGYGAAFWATQDQIELNLMLSLGGGVPQSLILGLVDEVVIDLVRQSVRLTGRDYTSLFIEAKTAEKFQNLSSSQVAELLAARQGLHAQVTKTTTSTGRFYDTDHADVTNEVSEWTLLTYLARHEGFDIYVEGRTLFFQPPSTTGSAQPYAVTYVGGGPIPGSNAVRLSLHRSLTLARDVVVKVISWNHEGKTAITSTRKAQKIKRPTGTAVLPAATYVVRVPGLSQTQADTLAASRLTELTLHERRIAFEMPGDFALTPRSLVRLSGTGSDFDQTYFVSQIRFECSLSNGLLMHVEAQNTSPCSVVTL